MQGIILTTTLLSVLSSVSAAPVAAWQSGTAMRTHFHIPVDHFFHPVADGAARHSRHGSLNTASSEPTASAAVAFAPPSAPDANIPEPLSTPAPVAVQPVTPEVQPVPLPNVATEATVPHQASITSVQSLTPIPSISLPSPKPAPAVAPAVVASPAVVLSAAPSPVVIPAPASPLAAAPPAVSVPVASAPPHVSVTQSIASVAAPAAAAVQSPVAVSNVGGSNLSADLIKAIMPSAASCAGAPFAAECRTADQAAPLLSQAFTKYNIDSKAAQAAVLALIALESGELKYNKAHYGDVVAGKGTRNMQSPAFNQKYATDVLGAGAVAGKDAATILTSLLANDATDFGSAAWFLSTQCPTVLQQFSTNPAAAWTAYLGPSCIGTSETAQRDNYFAAAKKALGVS